MSLQRKKEYICGCYRPELDRFPKIDLPVYPRSSGHFRKPADFQEKIPPGKKNFVQIFWGIEGEGLIEINGKNGSSALCVKNGNGISGTPVQSSPNPA